MHKSIMLLVTYKCNLHCTYCYEPKSLNFKMSLQKTKEIISEQLSLLGDDIDTVEIQFMGGEPLLEFPLIKEISEWIWNMNIQERRIILFAPTNGTLLNKEMRHWFTDNKDRITLGLSFDGNMVMQNINRSDSFNKIDLMYFVKTWPEQSVKMTISPETVCKLYDGVKSLHNNGCRYISADLAMGPNINWGKDSLIVFRDELKKLTAFYIDNPHLIPFSMLRLDIISIENAKRSNIKTCGCGESLICFDWTGNSYACHLFSPIALPLAKAKKSNELYDFNNHTDFNSEICNKCYLNPICNHCYGMNYLCTGDVKVTSSFHCSAFRLIFIANCRYMMQLAEKENNSVIINKINRVLKLIK